MGKTPRTRSITGKKKGRPPKGKPQIQWIDDVEADQQHLRVGAAQDRSEWRDVLKRVRALGLMELDNHSKLKYQIPNHFLCVPLVSL